MKWLKEMSEKIKERNEEKQIENALMQKGEMMYNNMCTPFDVNFTSIAEAKTYLMTEKPCGDIKGMELQAIGIYLNLRNK